MVPATLRSAWLTVRKLLGTNELTQNEPQDRSLLSTCKIGIVAFDKSKCNAKYRRASCEEDAQECQDRPLVGQIADYVGFQWVERMWWLRDCSRVHEEIGHLCWSLVQSVASGRGERESGEKENDNED